MKYNFTETNYIIYISIQFIHLYDSNKNGNGKEGYNFHGAKQTITI